MKYFSHSKIVESGEVKGSKLLKKHIKGVKEKATAQLCENVNFQLTKNELRNLLSLIVDLHDLGKYTSYFQNYLLDHGKIDHALKQHSKFGGYVAYNFLKKDNEKIALIALYIIFHHHSQLAAINDLPKKLESDSERVFNHQYQDIQPAISFIEKELNYKELHKFLDFPDSRLIRKQSKIWTKKELNIADYFLINYLFSILIEADKLDASETTRYSLQRINKDSVDNRFGIPRLVNADDLQNLSNNELRNYCRAEVISHLNDNDILENHLFTLTAPTGIGKTMTALDFALKLKTKLFYEKKYEAQIIYALPFINIIEQALEEYEITLKEDHIKILGHYQFADVFGICHSEDKKLSYNQRLMKLDTWQSDIVITSFVQFFETIISNRNKLLKKFNHLAGSIVILDEVQTLKLHQMPLIGAVLYYLAKFLDTRIITMTATKPKIFELAEQEILQKEGETVKTKELLTNHQKVFALFQRTAIHPLLECLINEEGNNRYFVDEIFASKWDSNRSCIIVCNTVNRSVEVYNEIENYLDKTNAQNPVYYLSTNILPIERENRIGNIKKAIKTGRSPILIATQVVEAGVDLDFDMGFRDIGPIDSIIQVAGRINRNNDKERSNAPLYVVDFGECKKIYGKMTYQQSKKALEDKELIPESDYLQIIEHYFDDIADRSSFRNSRCYFKSMKGLLYDSNKPDEDYAISSFKIIEDSDIYYTVFIEKDERANSLKEKFLQKIEDKITKEDFDKNYKMQFQQHLVTVPKYYAEDLYPINQYEDNILLVPYAEISDYYDSNTGFKRKREVKSVMML